LAKPEWGLKRTCLGCGARFYDMQRDPIVCPSCEAEFDPLALVRPRRARAAAASQAKAKAAAAKPVDDAAETVDAEDDELEIDDAAIDLDDDDDDDIIPDDDDDDAIADPDVSEVLDKAKDDDTDRDS
tara:strand:+ start:3747 stop:4130 length:384 start_codon:yes stop_codon:yes gene_type:complete